MSQTGPTLTAAEAASVTESLDEFLAGVERRAFRMAQVAVGDRESALDIVQDSMMKLVQNYHGRCAEEWRPLFFRILNNCINDWHRGQSRRWSIFERWFGAAEDGQDEGDAMDQLPGSSCEQPDRQLLAQLTMQQIDTAIASLSRRQQQAFMLRCWEGMDTAETAAVMECSEGTVKSLYSRAMLSLRTQLDTHYDR